MHLRSNIAIALAATLVLGGCATLVDNTPPLTVDALVTRAKSGESTESLLASLRGSRERFLLTGSDYAKLKERGLPDAVLDALQARALEDVRYEEWRRSQPDFFWRAWPYYGFQRPIIVVPPRPKS
jgi:hypothetical protein